MFAFHKSVSICLGTAMFASVALLSAHAAVMVSESGTSQAGDIENRSGAVLLIWDQGLNTDTTPDNSSGGTWPGVNKPSPYYGESDGMGGFNYLDKGVSVLDSSGSVNIADLTGAQITEDIRINSGSTVSISFSKAGDANVPATVSAVGVRMGGNANPVHVSFYDVNNMLINSLDTSGGTFHTPAFIAMNGSTEVSVIHRIDFSKPAGGFEVLGTLNDNPAKIDLSFDGFTAVPEPTGMALLILGISLAIANRRNQR